MRYDYVNFDPHHVTYNGSLRHVRTHSSALNSNIDRSGIDFTIPINCGLPLLPSPPLLSPPPPAMTHPRDQDHGLRSIELQLQNNGSTIIIRFRGVIRHDLKRATCIPDARSTVETIKCAPRTCRVTHDGSSQGRVHSAVVQPGWFRLPYEAYYKS